MGRTFLFEHRHLWLRSRRQVAIARVRHEVEQAIRDFFYERDFVLVDTPILTGSIGEEAGNLFSTDYFDLGKAYLAQTGQLYVEAAAAALGKVYCFGPTFRAEKSKTRRHLTEFWMVEPEVAFNDSDDNMRLQEEFVSYIVARVLERRPGGAQGARARHARRSSGSWAPFPRITYTDAVTKLQGLGSDIKWGEDLGGDDETLLAEEYDRPVFVCNYPKEIKAFYMKENPDDPRTVLCNDCLAPEGYGEIIGGSQREDDHDKLLARIGEQGLDPEAYGWYLDLRKYGTFVHSGSGSGSSGPWRGSAASRTSASRSRFRGRSTGCIRRPISPGLQLPGLHLVPQPIQRRQPRRGGRSRARRPAARRPRTGRGTSGWRGRGPCPGAPRPCGRDSPRRTAGRRSHRSARRGRGARRSVLRTAPPRRCPAARVGQLLLHLRQLLPHLGQRSSDIGPVEPHRGRPLLQSVGARAGAGAWGRGRRGCARRRSRRFIRSHGWAGPRSKRCGWRRRILRSSSSATSSAVNSPRSSAITSCKARWRRKSPSSSRIGRVAGAEGLIELEHFLDQVGPQRLPGLGPVPRAPRPQVPDHRAWRVQALNSLAFILRARYHTRRLVSRQTRSRRPVPGSMSTLARSSPTPAPCSRSPAAVCFRWSKPTATVSVPSRWRAPSRRSTPGASESRRSRRAWRCGRRGSAGRSWCSVRSPRGDRGIPREDLRPVIGDLGGARRWFAAGDRPFHVEIDTGMARVGFRWSDAAGLSEAGRVLGAAPGWEGVFTHFPLRRPRRPRPSGSSGSG